MNIYEKLLKVQNELKAPKNHHNSFGNYDYRSAEDIESSVKPLLLKEKLVMFISDSLETINCTNYLVANITLVNIEEPKEIINIQAYAKENTGKKGFAPSQETGATSSYARKYALNGLFLIDDTKDADTNEYRQQSQQPQQSNQRYQNYQGYNRQRNYQNNNYNQNNYNNNKNYNGGN